MPIYIITNDSLQPYGIFENQSTALLCARVVARSTNRKATLHAYKRTRQGWMSRRVASFIPAQNGSVRHLHSEPAGYAPAQTSPYQLINNSLDELLHKGGQR